MEQSAKHRFFRSKSKYLYTEATNPPYEVISQSTNIPCRICPPAQAKLQLNPIYKLNSITNVGKQGLTLHQKRRRALHLKNAQPKKSHQQIPSFFEIGQPMASASKAAKSITTEMNPAFREKMKKHLRRSRNNLTAEI